ncbi:hypothetical protein CALCODRAFT_493809 [Calocera cornea HHB12733]|uniref:Uncharacterized protein n=1 Tax=Calocera cornea HHB12733 TaxID=1353952 RepID=A0A165HG45_9BASI|nr:hypothetical protein CALCODRAFT_493809 [Calocera cornea HHB12733]
MRRRSTPSPSTRPCVFPFLGLPRSLADHFTASDRQYPAYPAYPPRSSLPPELQSLPYPPYPAYPCASPCPPA